MSTSLEDFLRQAAEVRLQRQLAAAAAEGDGASPGDSSPGSLSPGSLSPGTSRPARAVSATPAPESIGHEAEFSARASQLGQIGRRADNIAEQRRHDVFEHRVGTLTQQKLAVSLAGAAGSPADAIRRWMQSPENVRAALILGEVLRSPVENW